MASRTDPPPGPPTGRPAATGRMSGWTIASFALAAASILLGLFTAIVGVICGYIGHRQGDPRARTAIIANVVIGVVGVVLALLLVAGG
jgi:uncharacterized membrane protein